MRKLYLLLLILFYAISLSAAVNGERRVYYVDVTGSMDNLKINDKSVYDVVTKNLKDAINNIEDPTTEIIVIPFTDKAHGLSTVVTANATPGGKKKILESINNFKTVKNCHTNLNLPMKDFISSRVDPNRTNYMFLMTDGVAN